MAIPKVFISSTYYYLKQERDNIARFIKDLGYEPIMHERAGVTYTQNEPLEKDCYNEIENCEILVCIIGNHFGSQSLGNDYSITMNELKSAMKDRKKIFIFIAKDVFVENETYLKNRDNAFIPAFADDIKIHEFVAELKATVKNNPIVAFDNTNDITAALRNQFAGMFQRLLTNEATLTNTKTVYDLKESADEIKKAVMSFNEEKENFFKKFDSSIFAKNMILQRIEKYIGLHKSSFFAGNIEALDEFMVVLGFEVESNNSDWARCYEKKYATKIQTLRLKRALFDENAMIKDIRETRLLDDYIKWDEKNIKKPSLNFDDDDSDIPF